MTFISGDRDTPMRVAHESGRILAREVEMAEPVLSQGTEMFFRRSVPDGYALAFRFAEQQQRAIRMLFVFTSLDVCWLRDGIVEETRTLRPWIGHASAVADTVIEFPAGTLDGGATAADTGTEAESAGVGVGDRIELRSPS